MANRTITWLQQRPSLILAVALLLTALVYLPGVSGGFIYDDYGTLVDNAAVKVSTLALGDWIAAARSFTAEHQGRWLGMLSFAINHYFSGIDPTAYKWTNLVIHLGNGWLLWLMLSALVDLNSAITRRSGAPLLALSVACLWLVLPINLTSVLYVSQRFESLALTFVLIGLWGYLRLRLRDWHGEDVGLRMAAVLVSCAVVGAAVKESALLLPLYVGCIEWALPRFRRADGHRSTAVVTLLAFVLVVPTIMGMVWLASWVGGERSYAREFNMAEGLITQIRVLGLYIGWTLLPILNDLTLYHDDIRVSRGILDPPTTLIALGGLAALLTAALLLRRRVPLFAVGILLFFAGHTLTSGLVPLTLAFEHRNYFPSVGLLLATAALVQQAGLRSPRPFIVPVVVGLLLMFYGGSTHLRAREWSDPLRLAAAEAAKRPLSANAQYEYARMLITASGDDAAGPLATRALEVLTSKRDLPGAGFLYFNAIAQLKARRGEDLAPEEWQAMVELARQSAPRSSDAGALKALYRCMHDGPCVPHYDVLREVLESILKHPRADAAFHSMYGLFLYQEFGDIDGALAALDKAYRLRPGRPEVLFNRAQLQIAANRTREARETIEQIRQLGIAGSADRLTRPLETSLRNKESGEADARSGSGPGDQ